MPRSPGDVFCDRWQELLPEAGFDVFVEETCKPFYAPKMGAPSLPPGRYFRMYMIGYFEGLASERGIVWRRADSRSLGDFLRLGSRDKVPDHSWLSKTRSRLPYEVHEKVFEFVLKLVAERGLVKGERIGVDTSTMEANAALRSIVRRDSGDTYREMLTRITDCGKEAMRKRGEVVERSFAHVLERGGMRRTWLRVWENVHKRYLVHVAGHNLGILMRALFGTATPKETAVIRNTFLFVIQTAEAITVIIVAAFDADWRR
jgi:transposase